MIVTDIFLDTLFHLEETVSWRKHGYGDSAGVQSGSPTQSLPVLGQIT